METNNAPESQTIEGINRLTVAGYKSIVQEQSIEIRPLTILAGANSSGKSSIMQPLLLLKQTLEAPFDPGPLLLDGPIVKFTSVDQFLSHVARKKQGKILSVGFAIASNDFIEIQFVPKAGGGLEIKAMTSRVRNRSYTISEKMEEEDLSHNLNELVNQHNAIIPKSERSSFHLRVVRDRCFLEARMQKEPMNGISVGFSLVSYRGTEDYFTGIIYLSGLRGNPARNYPVTAIGPTFPGTFDQYFASIINHWQTNKENEKLEAVGRDLERLGLSWKVGAKRLNDVQVEVQVGRLPKPARGHRDMVSIADVGLGISQTLPVLVALHVARPGQLVYLEQPEIHLHPRAQIALAEVLADAANRGVRVVVETHSNLLLTAIQTLVAQGKLSPEKVILHWFTRRPTDGITEISSAELDEAGAFGDWPEDFSDVTLKAEYGYLDAAESHLFGDKAHAE